MSMSMVHQPLDKHFNPEYRIDTAELTRENLFAAIKLFREVLEKEKYYTELDRRGAYVEYVREPLHRYIKW